MTGQISSNAGDSHSQHVSQSSSAGQTTGAAKSGGNGGSVSSQASLAHMMQAATVAANAASTPPSQASATDATQAPPQPQDVAAQLASTSAATASNVKAGTSPTITNDKGISSQTSDDVETEGTSNEAKSSENTIDADSEGSSQGESDSGETSGVDEKGSSSKTTSDATTTGTTTTTGTGTTTGTTTTSSGGGPGAVFQKPKEQIKTVEAKTSTYESSSISQKTERNLGEEAATYSALAVEVNKSNPAKLSQSTRTLTAYHFNNAASAAKAGHADTAKANAVAGYATVFSELLSSPSKMNSFLSLTMPEDQVKGVMDVFKGIQEGSIPLPGMDVLNSENENATATGQSATAGNTVAMILGAFSADVSNNEVMMAQFSSDASQDSADIGQDSVSQASGQLTKLQKDIKEQEDEQKKLGFWGKFTQDVTIAVTCVAIVAVAVVMGASLFGGEALDPVLALTMVLLVGSLGSQISAMQGGPNVQQEAINGIAQGFEACGLSKSDSQMLAMVVMVVAVTALTCGAGGLEMGAEVTTEETATVAAEEAAPAAEDAGTTAGEEEDGSMEMEEERIEMQPMGASSTASSTTTTTTADAGAGGEGTTASSTTTADAGAVAGGEGTTASSTTTADAGAVTTGAGASEGVAAEGGEEVEEVGEQTATTVFRGIKFAENNSWTAAAASTAMASQLGMWGAIAKNISKDFNLNQQQTMELTMALSVFGAILSMGTGAFEFSAAGAASKASKTAELAGDSEKLVGGTEAAGKAGSTTSKASAAAKSAEENPAMAKSISETTSRAMEYFFYMSELIQAGGDAAEGFAEVQMGEIYDKMSKLTSEMAAVEADMAIFNQVAEMQTNLSHSILENYSSSVQELEKVFATSQQQMAQGMQALADVVGQRPA
jgi:trimeric autotransporter adhesin